MTAFDDIVAPLVDAVSGKYAKTVDADLLADVRQEMAAWAYGPGRRELEREIRKADGNERLIRWVVSHRLSGAAKRFLEVEEAAAGSPLDLWFPRERVERWAGHAARALLPTANPPRPVGPPHTVKDWVYGIRWAMAELGDPVVEADLVKAKPGSAAYRKAAGLVTARLADRS